MGNFLSGCDKNANIEKKIAQSLQKKINQSNFDELYSISEVDTLYWDTEKHDGRYLDVSLEELGKLYLQGSLPCNPNEITIDDIIVAYKSNPFVQNDDSIFIQNNNKIDFNKKCSNTTSLYGGNIIDGSSEPQSLHFTNENNINSPTSSDTAYLQYKKYKKTYSNGMENTQHGGFNQNPIGGNSNNDVLKNHIYNTNIFSKHNEHYEHNNKKQDSMSHSELSELKKFIKKQQNNISESSVNSDTVSTIEHLIESTISDKNNNSEGSSVSNQSGGGNKIPFFSTESFDVSYGY